MSRPRVSIVINTYNRAQSLLVTLDGLRRLRYPDIEVVVVAGPCTDDTVDVVRTDAPDAKLGHCPERNLSQSRNIGIALAAGDIVAFIDDDAYPDPDWLDEVVPAFDDETVGSAGGPVFDHTGYTYQARYNKGSVYGEGQILWSNPTEWLNSPGGEWIPYPMGTNALFRRDHLLQVGGFDEEIEYFLDETDVCMRMVRAGLKIALTDRGSMFHKFLPSSTRGESRSTSDFSVIMKNQTYFACKYGIPFAGRVATYRRIFASMDMFEKDVRHHLDAGNHQPPVLEKFLDDRETSFVRGVQAYEAGQDLTRPAQWFDDHQEPFRPYRRLARSGIVRHIVVVSPEGNLPPVTARLATRGHIVRVVEQGEGWNRVDLEDGIWRHRIVPTQDEADGFQVAAQAEVDRIGRDLQPIDQVTRA